MPGNRCVVYIEPGQVNVENIDYPKLELPEGVPGRNRKCEHGVILKIVATNICGSDKVCPQPAWDDSYLNYKLVDDYKQSEKRS